MFVRPIEKAIELKKSIWVGRLFGGLVSKREILDNQAISRILNYAQARDMGSFYLLLELVLMNRLPLSPKILDAVKNNTRVHQILAKFKYKLPSR
jgi:hypothetical protein